MTYTSEEQIERMVERRFDALDARLMKGELSQVEYDRLSREISVSADACYRALAQNRREEREAQTVTIRINRVGMSPDALDYLRRSNRR